MKPMNFSDDLFMKILNDFEEQLRKVNGAPDKINYSKTLKDFLPKEETEVKVKAKLIFTATAYMKMILLTKDTTDEVGWHGIVSRLDDLTFKIIDILVFPQLVTGATVTPDADEYAKWTMGLDDDTFNHMRFHGHSHVRGGVSPSGVDLGYREDMLTNLGEDDFYIFLITNYDEKRHIEIFDKKTNTIYETEDVSVYVCDENGDDIMGWVKVQEESVKKKTYGTYTNPVVTAPTSTTPGTNTTGSTTTTTAPTETKKETTIEKLRRIGMPQTQVIHANNEYLSNEAYWSEAMQLWVYLNAYDSVVFCSKPPKIAIPNPNKLDHKEKKINETEKRKPGRPAKNENNKGIDRRN